jgi:hypothetical protein
VRSEGRKHRVRHVYSSEFTGVVAVSATSECGGVIELRSPEEEMMRRLLLVAIVAVLAVSCGSDSAKSGSEDQTDPVTSGSQTASDDSEEPETFDLPCETIFSIHADFAGDFEGYATPQEAAESSTGGASGLPDGEWKHFEDNKWVFISAGGENVARTEIEVWIGNATTTFATERYVSSGLEYCE